MNRILVGLGLSLFLAPGNGRSEELPWRTTAPQRPAAATLGAPRASLGAPIPQPAASPPVRSAAAFGLPQPVVRAQVPDLKIPPFDETGDGLRPLPKAQVTEGKGPTAPVEVLPRPQSSGAPQETVPPPEFGMPGTPLGFPPAPAFAAPLASDPPLFAEAVGAPVAAGSLGAPSLWYGSAEYLLWWTRSMAVPVLLTTGPAGSGGIIGQPGVRPIFGGNNPDPTGRSGARFNVGYWFGGCCNWGVDAGLFFLGDRGTSFAIASAGDPLLARPFVAPNTLTAPIAGLPIPGPLSEVIAEAGISAGGAVIRTDSFLWGAELNALRRGWSGDNWNLNFLGGYRFLQLTEDLFITEAFSGLLNPAFPAVAGVNGSITDHFRTANQFHGGQLGAWFQARQGRWVFDMRTKVALGVSVESADISGSLTQFGPTFITPTVPGGLLALNSNSGHFNKDSFAVVPEVNFNIGYNVTANCRVFVGYTFLYWSSVMRPGDQVDTRLDLTRIPIFTDPRLFPASTAVRPAAARLPAPLLKETDFWAQGLNFGVRLMW